MSQYPYKNGAREHSFYGHGKLLLSGEYFVLEGALALALPTTVGQSLNVKYRPSYDPSLTWKSFNREGKLWFEAKFEFWHFDLIGTHPTEEVLLLQKILRQARRQNAHFLRDGVDVQVETRLEFPLAWGLGSSSTLIHNISQWANVSPFELLFQTMGGSGHDIACAQSVGPILYKKGQTGPKWTLIHFSPPFLDQLYFVHLEKKQNTQTAIEYFQNCRTRSSDKPGTVGQVSQLTREFLETETLPEFERVIREHETLIARELGMTRVKDSLFPDYWGEIKSLGAWGGDFVLVTGPGRRDKVQEYFYNKGYQTFVPFQEMVLYPQEQIVPPSPVSQLRDPFFSEGAEDS